MKELLLKMYEVMLEIRIFEERVITLFVTGEIPGWLHSYIGEEAVATGVCLNLNKNDYIVSTHRGHGHCIAKGVDMNYMMAELFAKETGCCKGRGGSMHIADASVGILSANGIVGGGIPIAAGAAFGSEYKKDGKVTVSFFGDGAAQQGAFHESVNLASIWNLPVIFVCENNFYALSEPCKAPVLPGQTRHLKIENIADRASSYGIRGIIVDGMDVINVYEGIKSIIEDVRQCKGPVLVEAKTYRYKGHFEGDPQYYRTKEEINEWIKKDPILALEKKLIDEKIASSTEIENINKKVAEKVEKAIDYARKSPEPSTNTAFDYIF
ncbi:MAG: thiamine pyrophosphate-dependent dehydrogenase E1 component subunit alpha [Actinobacteria bacterium]|nr:thiamine pyrophosphate-dependent dehydrogenase E1 component subunit alpha [Actinomycetota bacterium]